MAKKIKKSVNDEVDIKGAIIVVLSIVIIILVMYALTLGAKKLGWFDLGYTKPSVGNATISYDNILAGMTFNRADSEYYVLLADFDSEDSIYLRSLENLYNDKKDGKLPIYAVNLGNDMNKSVVSEEDNPSAQSPSELKISDATLIKISNGRNVKYVKGVDDIKTELGV